MRGCIPQVGGNRDTKRRMVNGVAQFELAARMIRIPSEQEWGRNELERTHKAILLNNPPTQEDYAHLRCGN